MPLKINGETVADSVLDQEFSAIKAHFERQAKVSCCERDEEFRGYARENVIARVLLAQEARRRAGSISDEEITQTIARLMEEHGSPEAFYFNMGLSPDQEPLVRENVETSLAVDRLLAEVCGEESEPTESDLRRFYHDHIADYTTVEEVRASHIFKSLRRVEDRETIFRELCEVRESLLNGADFEEMARKHSDKPAEEIDLGFYKRGELMDEFEFITFSMRVGEISPVFGTPQSFHLAKVTGRKPATPKPFEEVRDQVREAFVMQRRTEKVRGFIQELKKTAQIETP